MENKSFFSILFDANRRVFFILLAFALLLQGALFLQDRARRAFGALSDDFVLALTLTSGQEARSEEFLSALRALEGVQSASRVYPLKNVGSFDVRGLTSAFESYLPSFYEVKVKPSVLLNVKGWTEAYINTLPFSASSYFKEEQAQTAVYLDGVIRLTNILFCAAALALLVFGFFVEAYPAKPTLLKARFAGVVCALFAYGFAAGLLLVLASPLNLAGDKFVFNLWSYAQGCALLICLLTGWVLAKWKKF